MDIHSPQAKEILELAARHRERRDKNKANPNLGRRKAVKAEKRFNSCERKVCYTHDAAVGAAKHIKKRHGDAAEAYHCKLCGSWHVANVFLSR
jgi:hypothetical protein